MVADLLAEMQDVKGSARFENCDKEFGYSKCVRQGGVEAPVLWDVLWKAEERWKARVWETVIWEEGGRI